jgi:hypothetical protein
MVQSELHCITPVDLGKVLQALQQNDPSLLGVMQDGANISARIAMPFYRLDLFKPYVVFDVSGGRDEGSAATGSRYNLAEINMALALFQEIRNFLVSLYEEARGNGTAGPPACRIGILSPYRCPSLEKDIIIIIEFVLYFLSNELYSETFLDRNHSKHLLFDHLSSLFV